MLTEFEVLRINTLGGVCLLEYRPWKSQKKFNEVESADYVHSLQNFAIFASSDNCANFHVFAYSKALKMQYSSRIEIISTKTP